MRQLIGAGTPKEAVARGYMAIFLILTPVGAFLVTLLVLQSAQFGFAATFMPRERAPTKRPLFNGLLKANS